MRWIHEALPRGDVETFARKTGVSTIVAELLLHNGIASPDEAMQFLTPRLADLNDPFKLVNLKEAAQRICRAIQNRESITVLGDYDVDGVSSTALLVGILRRFGSSPRYVVPRRMEDGYGLSMSAIERAMEQGTPDLFIALDCGTNSHEEISYLTGKGIDVIVVDHHQIKEVRTLSHSLLVNPHVYPTEGDTPWRNLCTVGLVFKLVHGIVKILRGENNPVAQSIRLRDELDLAALGTVADLVPLTGENRILSRYGLRILQKTERYGLQTLMKAAGVNTANGLLPVDISFRLGPRINASGRMADASLSVDLLLSRDRHFCEETARQLNAFNSERQDIERQMTAEAEDMIEENYRDDAGIVLYSENWHP